MNNDERHTQDSDCTLNSFDCCTVCGVFHGDPCPECTGRGFHKENCSESDATTESGEGPPPYDAATATGMYDRDC